MGAWRLKKFYTKYDMSCQRFLQSWMSHNYNQRPTGFISMYTLQYPLKVTEHFWVYPECNVMHADGFHYSLVIHISLLLLLDDLLMPSLIANFRSLSIVALSIATSSSSNSCLLIDFSMFSCP
uniref:Uncharacterized protein n=1 Tax=Arion vulgaris TaxID=1028688 RepID=A0A0B6ZRK3_9EUPU